VDRNVNLKTVLVGEDAIVVGLGNSAFQDITYGKLVPEKKSLRTHRRRAKGPFFTVKFVVQERIRLGGKDQFIDLYGKQAATFQPWDRI
jgi:hypothetical protein